MNCPKCRFDLTQFQKPTECPQCGIIFSKFQPFPEIETTDRQDDRRPPDTPKLPFETATLPWWTELVIFLGLLIVAWVFTKAMPTLTWKLSIWIHEFGHAFPSWFSGIAATPLPIGWTNTSAHQSWMVTLCFSFLMIAFSILSFQRQAYFFSISFALGFLVQFYFRFLDYSTIQFWITYMGQGGEYLVSAWIIMAFHHYLPRETYWDILKYPLGFIALITLIANIETWFGVAKGIKEIPWGALWGDGGDMENLRDIHGWSAVKMGSSYYKLGLFTLIMLAIHFIGVCIFKGIKQQPIIVFKY